MTAFVSVDYDAASRYIAAADLDEDDLEIETARGELIQKEISPDMIPGAASYHLPKNRSITETTREYTQTNLEYKTLKTLQQICAEFGIKKAGRKQDIITRILDHWNRSHHLKTPKTGGRQKIVVQITSPEEIPLIRKKRNKKQIVHGGGDNNNKANLKAKNRKIHERKDNKANKSDLDANIDNPKLHSKKSKADKERIEKDVEKKSTKRHRRRRQKQEDEEKENREIQSRSKNRKRKRKQKSKEEKDNVRNKRKRRKKDQKESPNSPFLTPAIKSRSNGIAEARREERQMSQTPETPTAESPEISPGTPLRGLPETGALRTLTPVAWWRSQRVIYGKDEYGLPCVASFRSRK
eukprot:TRINITY_DN4576_c0_g1_i1.p1 TRINITY_DN4576_c0_g1~~TRINITY_DN4576_c0_g1_i1.p1  ORF type:complete len:374 (+),score=102.37 TRINITY_DN4576_c0_g1_i1:64-1122(+)